MIKIYFGKEQSEALISNEKGAKKLLLLVHGIDSNRSEMNRDPILNKNFKNALWDLKSDIPVLNAYTELKIPINWVL